MPPFSPIVIRTKKLIIWLIPAGTCKDLKTLLTTIPAIKHKMIGSKYITPSILLMLLIKRPVYPDYKGICKLSDNPLGLMELK
jgi:hypothetical protein